MVMVRRGRRALAEPVRRADLVVAPAVITPEPGVSRASEPQ